MKTYSIKVKQNRDGKNKWFDMGYEFETEAAANRYGESLKRDYPEIAKDYMVLASW